MVKINLKWYAGNSLDTIQQMDEQLARLQQELDTCRDARSDIAKDIEQLDRLASGRQSALAESQNYISHLISTPIRPTPDESAFLQAQTKHRQEIATQSRAQVESQQKAALGQQKDDAERNRLQKGIDKLDSEIAELSSRYITLKKTRDNSHQAFGEALHEELHDKFTAMAAREQEMVEALILHKQAMRQEADSAQASLQAWPSLARAYQEAAAPTLKQKTTIVDDGEKSLSKSLELARARKGGMVIG